MTTSDPAVTASAAPRTRRRLDQVLALVRDSGAHGITVVEVRTLTGLHHGAASSALSSLHREGQIVMLAEQHARCHIYVLPEHVNGRAVAQRRRAAAGGVAPVVTVRAIDQSTIRRISERAFADGVAHGREQAMRDATDTAEARATEMQRQIDQSWQDGYDAGLDAAQGEAMKAHTNQTVWQTGYAKGRQEADAAILEFVDQMILAVQGMKRPIPVGSGAHLVHPLPALRSVRAFITRHGAMV